MEVLFGPTMKRVPARGRMNFFIFWVETS